MTYYIEKHKDTLYQKNYPVLVYDESIIVSENPFVNQDKFHIDEFCYEPYMYIQNEDSIFIQFYDISRGMLILHLEYSTNEFDTVKYLVDWSSLIYPQTKNGIRVNGVSTYSGEKEIVINGKSFQTYCFLEDHKDYGSHGYHYIREVYIDKATLIPIKIISTRYELGSGNKSLYYSVIQLESTANKIPNYVNERDLLIYQDTSTTWTKKQRNEFIKLCSPETKSFCECLLPKLDGKISFFQIEKSEYFKTLVRHGDCK